MVFKILKNLMKNLIIVQALVLLLFSCDSGGTFNNKNPNIPNYSFNLEIDMSLPGNSNLQFASNHIVNYSVGARGIVVFNTGNNFVAFDLACPNIPYANCETPMEIDGIEAICECDDTTYNLFSGQGTGQEYAMKQYRTSVEGNIVIVYN